MAGSGSAPKPHAGRGARPGKERRRWRPKFGLTALAAVVAIATGMFQLRDEIFPKDTGTAQASVTAYQAKVGAICAGVNHANTARVADIELLRTRLAAAKTVDAQRNAVLDSWTQVSDASQNLQAEFNGLNVPTTLATESRATTHQWNLIERQQRGFIRRLEAASDGKGLNAAVRTLPATDESLATEIEARDADLIKLGGSHCAFNDPIPTPTVTLPGVKHSVVPPNRVLLVPRPEVRPPVGPPHDRHPPEPNGSAP